MLAAVARVERKRQRDAFVDLCDAIDAAAGRRVPRSLANSSAVFRPGFEDFRFDLVRPGMGLFGLDPTPFLPPPPADATAAERPPSRKTTPCVSVFAPVIQVRFVPKGDPVGYNESFVAPRDTAVAVVRVGYGDGLPRALSNKGRLWWTPPELPEYANPGGASYALPITGMISMDSAMVDITDVPPQCRPKPGDNIEVFGTHQNADDVAAVIGTIGHELLTRLSQRMCRVYLPAAKAAAPPAAVDDAASDGDAETAAGFLLAKQLEAVSDVDPAPAAASDPAAPTDAAETATPASTSDDCVEDPAAFAASLVPRSERRAAPPPEMTARAASYVYAMTAFLHERLAAYGVRYYLEGGSLLGQARDGGIIRFDDDADVQIHPDDTAALLAHVERLRADLRGWACRAGETVVLRDATFGFKLMLYPKDPREAWELYFDTLRGEWAPGFAIVDLFLMEAATPGDGDAPVRYADPVIREQVARRGYGDIRLRRLGALPCARFGPIEARVPEDARGAAEDVFGPACWGTVQNKDGSSFSREGGSSVRAAYDAALFEQLRAAVTGGCKDTSPS